MVQQIIINNNEGTNIPNHDTKTHVKNIKQTSVKFQGGIILCNKTEDQKTKQKRKLLPKFFFPS